MLMILYLLDTNAISEPIKPRPSTAFIQRFDEHRSEIAIASVSLHEVLFGCYRLPISARRTVLEDYILTYTQNAGLILEYGLRAAEWHARERTRLTGAGLSPLFPDGQIAAIAAVNNLTLVTRNGRHFKRVSGLRVASW